MGFFDKLKKMQADTNIYAIADGEIIDVSELPDETFAQQLLGESLAFRYEGDSITLCSPADGTLTAVFPTGHAFGVTMNNGVELLVHCGIDTVQANGDGFKVLGKKEGQSIKAGDPVVEVDLKKLGQTYNMSTMLIITNTNNQPVHLSGHGKIRLGEVVGTL